MSIFDTSLLSNMRILFKEELSAPDKEPITSLIDAKVETGRAVLSFEDGTIRDRQERGVWNAFLRPRGEPKEILVLPAQPRAVSWSNPTAKKYNRAAAKAYFEELSRENAELVDELSRKRAALEGTKREGSKVRTVSFASIQETEAALSAYSELKARHEEVQVDWMALKWVLDNAPEGVAEPRVPVRTLPHSGRRLVVYGTPTITDVQTLRNRATRFQQRHGAAAAWDRLFLLAPEESVKKENNVIKPLPVPQAISAPLATWFRTVKNGAMPPNVLEAWAWTEMVFAWNSLHIGPKIGLPTGIRAPTTAKPTGNARAKTAESRQLEQLQKTLAAVVERLEKQSLPRTSTPPPTQEAWWSTWQAGPWMAQMSTAFKPMLNAHPDRRFNFLVLKDNTPMTWKSFVARTPNAHWTPAMKHSHEYLAALVSSALKDRVEPDDLNKYLSVWGYGPTSPAGYCYADSVPLSAISTEDSWSIGGDVISALALPYVYNVETGQGGLWPACIFAGGVRSKPARDFKIAPIILHEKVKDYVEGMKSPSGTANDELFGKTVSLASAFASLADMQKEMVSAVAKKEAEWNAWLASLHARRNRAQTTFDKAVWSLVISDAEAILQKTPWDEGTLSTVYNAYRDTLAQPDAAPEPSSEDQPEAEASEASAQAEAPPAQPEAAEPVEAPMSIEIDGLQYHALLESDTEEPTPQGIVHLMVIRHGIVYVCSKPTQVPKRTTKTVACDIKGKPYDVLAAGADWTPFRGVKVDPLKRPVPPPKVDKGKAKADPVVLTPETGGPSSPKKSKLPPAFPGRSESTQMNSCSCDTYPCVHTKSNIRAWHVNAKLPVQSRPKAVSKGEAWSTDDVSWPEGFESRGRKAPVDPMTKENPANIRNLPPPYHGDRVSPELLKAVRSHLRLSDEPLPTDRKLSKEELKAERAKRNTPRWVTAALSADPLNLEKIVKGEITKDSHIQGKPRAPAKSSVTPSGDPKVAPLTVGQRWASLKKSFKDVSLWANPATPREKQFKSAFDNLSKSASAKEREALPKLRRRPRNLPQQGTAATATTSTHSPLSGLNDLLTMAKLLGEVVKALNPR
jgi:hypothetical protein